MAALITALLAFFGPLLADWLKQCAAKRAERAAAKLPDISTYASEAEARDALFDQMIEDLPIFAPSRKRLLRKLKAAAAKSGVTSEGVATPLDAEDAAYLKAFAEAAAEE